MTAPDVRLRPVTPDDRAFLLAVYGSTRTDELALTDWSEPQKAAFIQQQFSAQDHHYRKYYPNAEFSVIEFNGQSVGRLYVDRWEREIRIMDMAILPGYRNAGIGSRLLGQLQSEAGAAGKTLSIHVERMNPALRLYERLGFRPAADKGVYLLLEWQPKAL